jgi:hypothetical protein
MSEMHDFRRMEMLRDATAERFQAAAQQAGVERELRRARLEKRQAARAVRFEERNAAGGSLLRVLRSLAALFS